MNNINSPEEYIAATRAGGYNIILASAPWCKVCDTVKPKLAALARDGVRVYIIDTEAIEDFADSSDVTKLPTIFLYKDGHPKIMHQGGDIDPVTAALV